MRQRLGCCGDAGAHSGSGSLPAWGASQPAAGCLTASPIQFVQSIHNLEKRRVEAPREAPAPSCAAAAQAAQPAQPGGSKVVDGVGGVVQHGGAKHAGHIQHVERLCHKMVAVAVAGVRVVQLLLLLLVLLAVAVLVLLLVLLLTMGGILLHMWHLVLLLVVLLLVVQVLLHVRVQVLLLLRVLLLVVQLLRKLLLVQLLRKLLLVQLLRMLLLRGWQLVLLLVILVVLHSRYLQLHRAAHRHKFTQSPASASRGPQRSGPRGLAGQRCGVLLLVGGG